VGDHRIKSLSPSELSALLRGRPGVLIGPSATTHPGILDQLNSYLTKELAVRAGRSYLETVDNALDAGWTSLHHDRQSVMFSTRQRLMWR
jgi:hypothetical protein